jgi:hypothetical protein
MRSTDQDKISLTLTVHGQSQANELNAAWREIVTDEKLTRLNQRDEDVQGIMDRAHEALGIIENAINQNPTSGQAQRLVRFIAGLYNGGDYPFDLTDLRTLDDRLANACLGYLNYDRLGKREVHRHLAGGEAALHGWLEECGIKPQNERR